MGKYTWWGSQTFYKGLGTIKLKRIPTLYDRALRLYQYLSSMKLAIESAGPVLAEHLLLCSLCYMKDQHCTFFGCHLTDTLLSSAYLVAILVERMRAIMRMPMWDQQNVKYRTVVTVDCGVHWWLTKVNVCKPKLVTYVTNITCYLTRLQSFLCVLPRSKDVFMSSSVNQMRFILVSVTMRCSLLTVLTVVVPDNPPIEPDIEAGSKLWDLVEEHLLL